MTMDAAPSGRTLPVIHLRHPLVLLGVLLFFVNDYTDRNFQIPAAEFALLGLVGWQMLTRPALLVRRNVLTALGLAALLAGWVTLMDHHHGAESGHSVRVLIRTLMFYGMILGYMLLPWKTHMVRLVAGFMVGYILNFLLRAPLSAFDPSTSWLLKSIMPTPAVVVFMLLHRRYLSRSLQLFLVGYLGFTLVTMPFIGSRGAFLSLIIGLGFYGLARLSFIKRDLLIALALYIPLIPITVVGIFYEPGNPYKLTDWLASINYATHSNVERTLMVYFNIKALKESPLTGIGAGADIAMMAPYYLSITGMDKTAAESPHNYYLELAVPYGLPALALALVIWWIFYRMLFNAALEQGVKRGVAAFACGTIAWIMLYQPVAGITRMDVVAMMIFGLFSAGTLKPAARS